MVGDNQGNIYVGKEGVGQAFRLGESDNAQQGYDDFLKVKAAGDAAAAKMKAEGDKTKVDLQKQLREQFPEFWWEHQAEMQADIDKTIQMGADILSAGIDPSKGTDIASQDYQKRLLKIKEMSDYSKQLNEQFEKDRDKYMANPDKYDQESFEKNLAWYKENSLQKAAEEGLLPPPLLPKEPELDLIKLYGDMTQAIARENPDPTDDDLYQLTNAAYNDPSKEDLRPTHIAAFNRLPEDVQKVYIDAGKQKGKDPITLFGASDLSKYFRKEPINFAKILADAEPSYTETGVEYEDKDGVTSSRKRLVPDANGNIKIADGLLTANAGLAEQLMAANPNLKSREDVVRYVSDQLNARVNEQDIRSTRREGDGVNGSGYGKKEIEDDRLLWYQAAMGLVGDTDEEKLRIQEVALRYIEGSEYEGKIVSFGGRERKDALPRGFTSGTSGQSSYNPKIQSTSAIELELYYPTVEKETGPDGKQYTRKGKGTSAGKKQFVTNIEGEKEKNFFNAGVAHGLYDQRVGAKYTPFKKVLEQDQLVRRGQKTIPKATTNEAESKRLGRGKVAVEESIDTKTGEKIYKPASRTNSTISQHVKSKTANKTEEKPQKPKGKFD